MARILVSEDDPHMLRLISMWLTRNGHEVVEATDGDAAREILKGDGIELLVSDVNMPRMSGMELVRWARGNLERQLPIILLSSRCDQSAMNDELREYQVRLHPKPFSPSRLMVEVDRLLSGSVVTPV